MASVKALRLAGESDNRVRPNLNQLKVWIRRHRTRKQLYRIVTSDPDRLANDLGIEIEVARAECKKPFWLS